MKVEDRLAEVAAKTVEKEWVEDPSESADTMRWRNTETGEYRYQESKPGGGASGEESTESEGAAEAEEPKEFIGPEGEYRLRELTGEDMKGDVDRIMIHDQEFEVEGFFQAPNGEWHAQLELDDGNTYTPAADDVQGVIMGEALDTGEYDPESEFGREVAHGITTGEMNKRGSDGFIGAREFNDRIAEVQDPNLLADALVHEKENRNSKTATKFLERRIRALDEDPDALLKERGWGKGGGEGEGDYPIEGYDSAIENLEDLDGDDSVWESYGGYSTRGTGIKNREEWEAIVEHADTSELEEYIIENSQSAYRDDDGGLRVGSISEIKEDQTLNMLAGTLYYREDSRVGLGEALFTQKIDDVDFELSEMEDRIEGVLGNVDPTVGAALMTHTDKVEATSPENKSWNGVYRGSSGSIGIENLGDPESSGSPDVVAHELGHSLHYMMGIDGGGSWGDNSWGEPNEKQVSTPTDEIMDSGETHSGQEFTDEAVQLSTELEREWERYQDAQLGGREYVEDPDAFETGEEYELDGSPAEYLGTNDDGMLEFELSDGSVYRFPPSDTENMAIPDPDHETPDVKQLRSYQAKGLHEFFTVTFSHWNSDRAKLHDSHPEMEEIYDEYFGKEGTGWQSLDAKEIEREFDDLGPAAGEDEALDIVGADIGDRLVWEEDDGYEKNFEIDSVERIGASSIWFRGKDERLYTLRPNEANDLEVLKQ